MRLVNISESKVNFAVGGTFIVVEPQSESDVLPFDTSVIENVASSQVLKVKFTAESEEFLFKNYLAANPESISAEGVLDYQVDDESIHGSNEDDDDKDLDEGEITEDQFTLIKEFIDDDEEFDSITGQLLDGALEYAGVELTDANLALATDMLTEAGYTVDED